MPKKLAANVRFLENVDTWGGKDAIDRERFLEAFYWASDEFDPLGKIDAHIIVLHCDKEMGEFAQVGTYPVAIRYAADPKSKLPYEVWFVGRVTDAMMMVAFTNIYAKALGLDTKAAAQIGQRAMKHLQSTVSVKQLERK